MQSPAPPRLPLWIVERRTRACDRDEVAGDLIEEHQLRAATDPRGARRWLWRQALSSLTPTFARRAAGRDAFPRRSIMRGFIQDIRFSARLLRQQPMLSSVAVLSLVIGLGLNLVLFTVANAVLYRPLPVPDPGSLVLFGLQRPTNVAHNFSYFAYETLRRETHAVAPLVAYSSRRGAISFGNETMSKDGELVSGTFFTGLGVPMAQGRGLTPDDDRAGAPPATVLSSHLWRERFGDTALAGQALAINGTAFAIVGIADARFHGMFPGTRADFWVPLANSSALTGRDLLSAKTTSWLYLMGRLSPGVSMQTARDQMDPTMAAMLASLGMTPQPLVARAGARGTDMLSARLESPLRLLMFAAGLVLLVAGVNVANLQLARNAARRRELAVRAALGAGRSRIVRLLVVDGFMLAVPAAAAALVAALAFRGAALGLITRFGEPVTLSAPLDLRTWLFAGAATIGVALFVGLLSAWQGARPVASALAEGGRGETGSRQRLQRVMVVVQFALSMTLLVGATLLVRSVWNLRATDLGFSTNVVAIHVAPRDAQISGGAAAQYLNDVIARVASVPGVTAASAASVMPLDFGGSRMSVTVPGYTPAPDEDMELNYLRVAPAYFETMEIPIARGRTFDARDVSPGPIRVIVNETMARRYWPGGDAVGRQLVIFSAGAPDAEVIGVVPDVRYRMVREAARPSFYLPFDAAAFPEGVIHARTSGDPALMIETLRRVVAEVHPGIPVARALSVEAQAMRNIADERMAGALGGVLGMSALLLAAAGLYGTMAFAVRLRTREIGVRMALGARSADVSALVVKQGFGLVLIGAVVGLAGAFWAGRALESQLYGVSPADAGSFLAAAALLGGAALLAAWIPARRATRVDPVIALRDT